MKKSTLLLVAIAMFAASCAKKGCTDPDSTNYDYNATKDDGSCAYEADVLFWYDLNTAKKYDTTGVKTLKFFVDNELLDTMSTKMYWETAPSCGTSSAIQKTINLSSSKTGHVEYQVKSQDDKLLEEGHADINANTCNQVKLK